MRIIGGDLGGRRIDAPLGRNTRPMLDRVREALFSRLQHDLPGARVLDLFAGSGSLGLESLSRGAERARLVERHGPTVALLRRNAESLGLVERAEIVRGDALAPAAWTWDDGATASDLVLVDAPYALAEGAATRGPLLAALGALVGRLAPGGTLVLHVPRGLLVESSFDRAALFGRVPPGGSAAPPPRFDLGLRQYGSNDLWFLAVEEAAP